MKNIICTPITVIKRSLTYKVLIVVVNMLALVFGSTCQGQPGGFEISGVVVDAVSKEPLPYATIIANNAQGVFSAGTATNEEGTYHLNLKSGDYSLQISFIGYQEIQQSIAIDGHLKKDFNLKSDAHLLEGVTIQEDRTSVEQKIDRKVINVGSDLQAGGGDAVEVLNQLAEVQTTPDGSIELRGSGNINVLVNGKPSPLAPEDLLQQIDANEIHQIELITTPSAKHRADGLTGIINIITHKKVKRGLSGSINGSLSSNQQYRSGVAVSHGAEKLNMSLGLNFSDRTTESIGLRGRASEEFNYLQMGDNIFDGHVKGIKAGLDWFLDSQNELSVSGGYTDNSHDIINTTQVDEDLRSYVFLSNNRHEHLSSVYNVNYRHSFESKDHYLEADIHHTDNRNALSALYRTDDLPSDNFLQYDAKVSNYSIDYVLPIEDEKMKLESGILYTTKDVSNEQEVNTISDEILSNQFNFDEISIGIYTLLQKNWNKLSGQFGLRYEGFWSDSQFEGQSLDISRQFHNLFPSAHMTYTFSEGRSLNIGYNRRTSRPNLRQVNPYANATDRYYNRQGNPRLNPEFSHSFEINFSNTFDAWSFNPGIFYRYKKDLILPFFFTGDGRTVFQSYANQGNSHAYGMELALSIFPFSFLRTSINGNFYWERIQGDLSQDFGFLNLNRNGWTFKNLFKISKAVNLDLTWIYRGDSTRRYSKSVHTQKLDIALRWKTLKGRGDIGFRVTDVFNTFQSQSELFGDTYTESSFRKWETNVAYLSIRYRFADGDAARKRNRKNRRFDEPGATE